MILFIGDGLFKSVSAPLQGRVPMIPVDTACELLMSNIVNAIAMKNHLFVCPLNWHKFLFMVSDHFKTHHLFKTFSSYEMEIKDSTGRVEVTY